MTDKHPPTACVICRGPLRDDTESPVCEACIDEQEQLIDSEVEDVYNRFSDQRGDA